MASGWTGSRETLQSRFRHQLQAPLRLSVRGSPNGPLGSPPGHLRALCLPLTHNSKMGIQAFHPILYVADSYAERDFFSLFGFETVYEGTEFPGFLAVECGSVCFGLSQNKELAAAGAHEGVRWQLIVDDVDDIAATCSRAGLQCEIVTEEGGAAHRARIAKVTSPNGVLVWFEGPNEIS
jgi:hypothetical protein